MAQEQIIGEKINQIYLADRPVHDWYRFVLSYPPHLVRDYLDRFGVGSDHCVLDPFCGTGTTIVECKKMGVLSVGVEANPMAHLASQVKVDWTPDPDGLLEHAHEVADLALEKLKAQEIEDIALLQTAPNGYVNLRTLSPEQMDLLLTDSISPLPLHKTLVLLDCLKEHHSEQCHRHELLALAKALVDSISNLHFGPEVGVGPAKQDAPVVAPWLERVRAMVGDLRQVCDNRTPAVAGITPLNGGRI